MGVKFRDGEVLFTVGDVVSFACAPSCFACTDTTPGHVDITLSGITLCSCTSFTDGSSQRVTWLGGWTPNGTFRLHQKTSDTCDYFLDFEDAIQIETFDSSSSCSGSPDSTVTYDARIEVAFLASTLTVSAGVKDPSTGEVWGLHFSQTVSWDTLCESVNETLNNSYSDDTFCTQSGLTYSYAHSGSATVTTP